jgi:hypothetical protein
MYANVNAILNDKNISLRALIDPGLDITILNDSLTLNMLKEKKKAWSIDQNIPWNLFKLKERVTIKYGPKSVTMERHSYDMKDCDILLGAD